MLLRLAPTVQLRLRYRLHPALCQFCVWTWSRRGYTVLRLELADLLAACRRGIRYRKRQRISTCQSLSLQGQKRLFEVRRITPRQLLALLHDGLSADRALCVEAWRRRLVLCSTGQRARLSCDYRGGFDALGRCQFSAQLEDVSLDTVQRVSLLPNLPALPFARLRCDGNVARLTV